MLDFLKSNIWTIFIVINYLVAISAIVFILLKNRNPTKTVSYILVLALFPFLGIFVYYLFGQEYRKTKLFNRKDISNHKIIKNVGDKLRLNGNDLKVVGEKLDDKIKLVKLLKISDRSPLTNNNLVEILRNGEVKFKQVFEDLKKARNHIHVEYYVLEDQRIGTEFLDILCDKAKEGLEVKLIYDDVGSKISSKMKRKLDDCGIVHKPFMKVIFSSLTGKSNYRNHRKIIVIDGEIGYVGGVNISDAYVNFEENNNSRYWRDTHLKIVGNAVKVLQFHFLTTWDFVSDEEIEIKERYFPELEEKGDVSVQIAASGPDTDWANIMEALLTAINNAEDYVYITTPYFIPNEQIVSAMQIASKIGVDVRLIVPKESDSWIAEHATNSYFEPLLRAGIKVYLYSRGFIHAKTMVVDDIFATVGTCNLDNRSFNINFEINALMYNKEKALELKALFMDDLDDCELLDKDRWEERSTWCKLQESVARLWAPLL